MEINVLNSLTLENNIFQLFFLKSNKESEIRGMENVLRGGY